MPVLIPHVAGRSRHRNKLAQIYNWTAENKALAKRIAAEMLAEEAAALAVAGEILRAGPQPRRVALVVVPAPAPAPVVSSIPERYLDVFEAVCLRSWDDARRCCGRALSWLVDNGFIFRSRAKYSRSKNDPLGRPATLTVKGQLEARKLGYEVSKIIENTPCMRGLGSKT